MTVAGQRVCTGCRLSSATWRAALPRGERLLCVWCKDRAVRRSPDLVVVALPERTEQLRLAVGGEP